MGYAIDRGFVLRVSKDVLPAALAAAEAAHARNIADLYNGVPFDPADRADSPIGRLTGTIEVCFGEGGSFSAHEGADYYSVLGSSWGKAYDSEDELLGELAAAGVQGTIDCVGEDGAVWRERLLDGIVFVYQGKIVYPDDPLGAE